MRRVHINGLVTLTDYCTGPSFASGGFIADSEFDGSTVINASQRYGQLQLLQQGRKHLRRERV